MGETPNKMRMRDIIMIDKTIFNIVGGGAFTFNPAPFCGLFTDKTINKKKY